MGDLTFLWLALGSVAAGLLGALTGLGGGVVLVPMLVLLFKVDLHYAIGASLISVIATSSGAASAYVREGYSNIRIGILLEVATTMGALVGAWSAHILPARVIAIVFGVVLLYSAWQSLRQPEDNANVTPDELSSRLRLAGTYPVASGREPYAATHVVGGFATMSVAGLLSGLLGIGSGAVKVLAMDRIMRLPFKVSTTTSNFMIGVTAAASAGLYARHGYIVPTICFPVMLGVLIGALVGARTLARMHVKPLRILFTLVLAAVAVQMIYQGAAGKL